MSILSLIVTFGAAAAVIAAFLRWVWPQVKTGAHVLVAFKEVEDGLSSVAGAAVAAYDQGVKLAHSVESAADAVGDAVGSAAGAVTDGLMTAASNVAGYALLGAAGLAGLIDDVV